MWGSQSWLQPPFRRLLRISRFPAARPHHLAHPLSARTGIRFQRRLNRNLNSNFPKVAQCGQQRCGRVAQRGRMFRQRARPGQHHAVRDSFRAGRSYCQSDRRKDIDVITLRNRDCAATVFNRTEGRTARHQCPSFGPLDQIRRMGLGAVRRIRQREDDGPLDLRRHLANNGFG